MNNISLLTTIKTPLAGPAMKAAVSFSAGIVAGAFFQFPVPVLLLLASAGFILLMITYRNDSRGNITVNRSFFDSLGICHTILWA